MQVNSKSIRYFENKKAICNDNIEQINAFTDLMTNYIKGLKLKEKETFVPILKFKQANWIFWIYCMFKLSISIVRKFNWIQKKIDHVKMYKTNRDHLALFLDQYDHWEVLIITLYPDNFNLLTKNWLSIQLRVETSTQAIVSFWKI